MSTKAGRFLLVGALIAYCGAACAADRVWYDAFKVTPRQHGSLKAHCYYNATSIVDVLTSPIVLSVAGYSYIFNATNDIKDTFYWKKQARLRWKYYADRGYALRHHEVRA